MGQNAQKSNGSQTDIQQALLEIKNTCRKYDVNYEKVEYLVNYLNSQNCKCINLIGKGTFGLVIKAIFQNEYVAIKVIEIKDTKKVQTLLQEYEMLKNFKNSKYILQTKYVQQAQLNGVHQLFIFTDLCKGELTELIQQKIAKKQILSIMIQLLIGLEELKQAKIIHNDIKPQNILYNYQNGNYTIKIADFGQAKQFNDKEYVYDLTRAGTRKYTSLEVLDADERISYKADVYSLGIVFIELIFGKIFDFGTEIKPLRNGNLDILNGRPILEHRDFDENNDYLINNIIKNMIQKNQQQRKSSDELLYLIFKRYLINFDFNQIIDYEKCLEEIKSLDDVCGIQMSEDYLIAFVTKYKGISYENYQELKIILKYLEDLKCNLKDLIQQKLSKKHIVSIIVQLLLGMEELSLMGIFHSDIQPSNILFNYKNGNYHAKINGFMSAQFYPEDDDHVKDLVLQGASQIYAFPELFDEEINQFAQKSDIYSLGVVFIELLFGRFLKEKETRILRKGCLDILSQKPNLANRNFNEIDNFLIEKVIKNMICVKEYERYHYYQLLEQIFEFFKIKQCADNNQNLIEVMNKL
ncbi:hypothetical protein ABPG72_002401 [Tetrahymena utriculariae]